MKQLLKNCRLIDSGEVVDILTDNKTILKIGQNITADAQIYDAQGRYVTPGFIDLHCHLRDPGYLYKETILSGTAAALAGGYSVVVCMPNTKPIADNPDVLKYILNSAASCAVYPTGSITIGEEGKELCDFDELTNAGAVAFTDDGKPVTDSLLMKRALETGYLIISHPEDIYLKTTNSAEDIMIARDLILAEETGGRLHLAHVSTRGGVRLIRDAKMRGVNVTCETCPHYFSFTKDNSNARMNPPLRSQADVDAIIEGLQDGTIDCISTDHAPHAAHEKTGENILNGITGLQTAFAAGVTNLVMTGKVKLKRLVELITINPAKILGFDVSIKEGGAANLNVIDIEKAVTIEESMLKSLSFNTPFLRQTLYGTVDYTLRSEGFWHAKL